MDIRGTSTAAPILRVMVPRNTGVEEGVVTEADTRYFSFLEASRAPVFSRVVRLRFREWSGLLPGSGGSAGLPLRPSLGLVIPNACRLLPSIE